MVIQWRASVSSPVAALALALPLLAQLPPVAPDSAGAREVADATAGSGAAGTGPARPWSPGALLPPRPHVIATRTAKPPVIDGRLDDPVWQTAPPSDDFVQHFPDEGAPATERTTVRVLYDDRNVYVGVDAEQLHAPVVKRLQRRDGQLPSDGVWMDIDSRRTGVGAFHFSANAAGSLSDGIHFNDTDFSSDWDAVWEAKVADTGHGYAIEFRIPLSVLRFSALPVQDWGFQVRRFIDANQETDDWAFYPQSAATYIPLFGRIDNLVGLSPGRALELRPFVLGKALYRAPDVGTTLEHGGDLSGSAGLDAKAHLTNELTLDLTVNPDFGQVEADTVILNLSTFETFFPEKRPFFLEGIDTFAAIRPLVYTRRIGHAPAPPPLGASEQLVADPEPSTIWGAAKVVGTVGGRTTVGLLSAVTGANEVGVITSAGVPVTRLVEPWTAYNVVRLKRQIGRNSDLGLLATAVDRFEPATPVGQLCGATQLPPGPDGRCTNDAYVASADGRWRSQSGDYGAAFQAVATTLSNGPPRPARDGIPVEPGHPAGGVSAYLAKDGGPHWLASAWQYFTGRQLEFNDLGYLERKNDYQGYFALTYRTLDPWWRTLQTRSWLGVNLRETLDGLTLWREVKAATSVSFRNFWSFYTDVHLRGAYYDDREVGDGTALQHARRAGLAFEIDSDPRRTVVGILAGDGELIADGYHLDGRAQLSWRALSRLQLDLLPTVSYDTGEPRYVATDTAAPMGGAYVFGAQTAASVGATVRAALSFTPELSLQLYTQLFLAWVHYGVPLECGTSCPVLARARVPITSLAPVPAGMPPAIANPDSVLATLNVNLVLRWEYRLGSTLFLVYTRAQNPALVPAAGGTSFELRPIYEGRAAEDVVLFKLAYWWG
jgi:hypothetical protein